MVRHKNVTMDRAVLNAIDAEVEIITLVTGTLENGQSGYAYVLIKPSRYRAFKKAQAKGAYDLARYGTIIAHGKGHKPTAKIRERMQREYGANHRFEEELQAILDDMD
jgi:hypothetical protein